MDDDRVICWWCGAEEETVFGLDGARLGGSPELALPSRLSERERFAMLVCGRCAVAFADLRRRHDLEVIEADVPINGTSAPHPTLVEQIRQANGANG